jgi:signal transduction histidine kinase
MLIVLAICGWLAATAAAAIAFVFWHQLAERLEIVARASHELRGPITAARLGLEFGELSPARLRALDLELGRATLALEDLAGADDRRPSTRTFERVDVRQLLLDSAEAWRPAAAERRVELLVSWSGLPLPVLGDRLRLAQATGNLIANAIEHGGGAVELCGRADSDRVRLEVIDEGPGLGVPVAELMSARRPGGRRGPRGHGLSIATEIVRDHGGHLASAPSEKGARLVIVLPAAGPGSEPARHSGA